MDTNHGGRTAAVTAGAILAAGIAFEGARTVTRWPDVTVVPSRLESGLVMVFWAVAAAVALMRDRTEQPSVAFRAFALAAPATMVLHGLFQELVTWSHSSLAFVAGGLGLALCFMRLVRTEAPVDSSRPALPAVVWVPRSFGFDKAPRGVRGLF